MDTPIKKPTHIVVEVFERDLGETRLCYGEDEAIEAANEMLDEHIKLCCGDSDDDDDEGYDKEEYEDDEDDDFDYQRASKTCSNAWCNYGDEHWDAYIIELKGE